MKVARVLASSAAVAVLTLTPQAAQADDYGEVAGNEGRPPVAGAPEVAGIEASSPGTLPSTGSTLLDTVIAGAGVLLIAGGGATVVASRRRQHA